MGNELLPVWLAVAFAAGCGTASSHVSHAYWASEAEHYALAEEHSQKAEVELALYDPEATVTKARGPTPRAAELGRAESDVNPTDKHLRRARRERARAEAHLNLAGHIEAFADVSCASVPSDERASCPLFLDARAEDIPHGVRIHLGEDAAETVERVRCQLAFARKVEHTGQGGCPLHVLGAHVEAAGGEALDLTTDRADMVAELRRRAREHVVE